MENNGHDVSCCYTAVHRRVNNICVCVCVFVNQGLVSGSEAHLRGAAAGHADINWLFVMVMCSSNVKARHSEVNSEIDQRAAKENSQDGQYIRHMFVLHAFHWPQRQNAVEVNTCTDYSHTLQIRWHMQNSVWVRTRAVALVIMKARYPDQLIYQRVGQWSDSSQQRPNSYRPGGATQWKLMESSSTSPRSDSSANTFIHHRASTGRTCRQ